MNEKNINAEENFAEEAVKAIPQARQMLVESTGLHTVLALSLADIYGDEAKRLKAKHSAADERVAEAKFKKSMAAERAKEIVEALVSRKVLAPTAMEQKKSDAAVTKPAAASEAERTAPSVVVKAPTKAAPRAKAGPKKKVMPKIKSKPPTGRAKPAVKNAPARKARPKK